VKVRARRAPSRASSEARRSGRLLVSESGLPHRSPHDINKLLILDVIRWIQANLHTTAISQRCQQIIARVRPQFILQCPCQAPRILMIHACKLTVSTWRTREHLIHARRLERVVRPWSAQALGGL
jgi:hypothetical protein